MDNPTFVDEENIPMVQDKDYDSYVTPDTSRIDDEASLKEPNTTEATPTLGLRQKVRRDQINELYRHLNVAGNLDLIDLDRFRLTKDPKKGVTIFEFYNGDRWVPLTKQTGDFFAAKTLRDRLGELNTMKKFLDVDKTSSALERSLMAATKA